MKALLLALLLSAAPAFAQHEEERSESRAAVARAISAEPEEGPEPEAAAAEDGKFPALRVYRISATSKGSRGATGKLSQIAGALKDFGAACVDLASLGMAAGGSPYMESETYGVLMHGRLNGQEREKISQAVCPGRSCEVKIKTVRIKPRFTAILASPIEGEKPRSQLLALIKKPLPRFSQSCLDGSNSGSDTASTPEAKEFLKEAGIDVEKARTLDLVVKTKSGGGSRLWSFGSLKRP